MVENNGGVTLIELLIVIVVLGIIAAFSIPAIGGVISNAKKDSIYNDAISLRSATKSYCIYNTCDEGQELTYNEISEYVQNFDEDYYELDYETGVFGEDVVSEYSDGTIIIWLYSKIPGSFDWLGADPTIKDRDFVSIY